MDQWNRAYFLPVARHGQTGEMSAAVPQSIIDVLRAFQLPGDVYSGSVQRNVPMFEPQGDELDALQAENPEYIKRLSDLAGSLTLGSGAIPAEKGALRMGASVKNKSDDGIRAYHGSPHDFDRFSLDKIGTGEGAQVYGHGLYFAENEGVARGYREALAGSRRASIDGAGDSLTKAIRRAEREASAGYAAKAPDYDGVIKQEIAALERNIEALRSVDAQSPGLQSELRANNIAGMENAIAELRAFSMDKLRIEEPGRMYEVRIKANPDDFLDWDKPWNEQPRSVQNAIWDHWTAKGGARNGRTLPPYASDEPARIESILAAMQTVSDKAGEPEAALRNAGIPGIKYLDAGSRSAGDGSRNYVVFDDKLIEIVRKYGIAALVSAGVISQADGEVLAAEGYPE